MDCSPPGSFVHGILQARILEWVPIPPSGASGHVSCIGRWVLYHYHHLGSPQTWYIHLFGCLLISHFSFLHAEFAHILLDLDLKYVMVF